MTAHQKLKFFRVFFKKNGIMVKLLSNKAFGLIEVLVAMGMMTIVTMGIISLMTSQQKETRAVSETLAKLDLEKLLIAALADGSICTFELTQTPNIFDSTQLTSAAPPKISLNVLHASADVSAPALIQVGETASAVASSLKIESIVFQNITDAGISNRYLADLVISFNGNTVRAVRNINMKMSLVTVADTPPEMKKIVGCLRAPGTGDLWTLSPDGSSNIYYNSGSVGIGVAVPTAKLQVVGGSGSTLQIVDGNQAGGKVLTSDASGMASWQTPPPGADNLGNHTATGNLNLAGFQLVGNGGSGIYVDAAGKVGIGSTAPSEKLDLGGGNIKIGYEQVSNTCPGPGAGATAVICEVNCSSGKYVVGGGCIGNMGAGNLQNSYPSSPTKWTCWMNALGTSGFATIEAWAICLNVR